MTQTTFQSAQSQSTSSGIIWTISRIAERDGVTKQAVSKNVHRMLGRGLFVERNARGEIRGVDVVEYNRLLGRVFDATLSSTEGFEFYRIARAIEPIIERLPLHAAEIAEAAARGGEAGARVLLKALAFDLQSDLTGALRKVIDFRSNLPGGKAEAGGE